MADVPGLRPTPNRVKETLFNWLQEFIPGAHCLDLFAGSGSLGFEALSRGAVDVHFVDQDPSLIDFIRSMATTFSVHTVHAQRAEAGAWLRSNDLRFDLIFLDPPFHQGLIETVGKIIIEKKCLNPGGLIYIECEPGAEIPAGLQMQKQKTAGGVQYGLYVADNR